jgi:DNA-binding NarL/FixJ family response regulator
MPVIKICLVEDQDLVRKSLAIVLGMEEDIEVLCTAENGEKGIEVCET